MCDTRHALAYVTVACVVLWAAPALAERFVGEVHDEDFSDETLRDVAEAVRQAAATSETLEVNRVCDRLTDAGRMQVVIDLYHESAAKGDEAARFEAALRVIREDGRRHELRALRQELADARSSGDEVREVELLKRHQDLMK